MSRINRAIELLEQDQPIYYMGNHSGHRGAGGARADRGNTGAVPGIGFAEMDRAMVV